MRKAETAKGGGASRALCGESHGATEPDTAASGAQRAWRVGKAVALRASRIAFRACASLAAFCAVEPPLTALAEAERGRPGLVGGEWIAIGAAVAVAYIAAGALAKAATRAWSGDIWELG